MKKVLVIGGVLVVGQAFGLMVGTAQDQAVQSGKSQFEAHRGFDRGGSAEQDIRLILHRGFDR